jgi:hypothetical protein
LSRPQPNEAQFHRKLDRTMYISRRLEQGSRLTNTAKHQFVIMPGDSDTLELVCAFSPKISLAKCPADVSPVQSRPRKKLEPFLADGRRD